VLSEMLRAFKKNLRSYGIGASHLPVVRSIIHANIVRMYAYFSDAEQGACTGQPAAIEQ